MEQEQCFHRPGIFQNRSQGLSLNCRFFGCGALSTELVYHSEFYGFMHGWHARTLKHLFSRCIVFCRLGTGTTQVGRNRVPNEKNFSIIDIGRSHCKSPNLCMSALKSVVYFTMILFSSACFYIVDFHLKIRTRLRLELVHFKLQLPINLDLKVLYFTFLGHFHSQFDCDETSVQPVYGTICIRSFRRSTSASFWSARIATFFTYHLRFTKVIQPPFCVRSGLNFSTVSHQSAAGAILVLVPWLSTTLHCLSQSRTYVFARASFSHGLTRQATDHIWIISFLVRTTV